MSMQELLPLYIGARVYLPFDFLGEVPFGATISSAHMSSTVYSGNDGNLTLGSVTIVGTVCKALAYTSDQALDGNIYLVKCWAVLSDGQTLEKQGYLAILSGTTS